VNATDLFTLARTVWGESRGEPDEGKAAVAHVVLNRFRSGKWFAANSIAETCRKPWQFSCWNDNDPNRDKLLNLTLGDKGFLECVDISAGCLAGRIEDPTGGANHYHAARVHPSWAEGHESSAIIGNHIFYTGIN